MTGGLDPTEEYDGTISVVLYDDSGERERLACSSYEEAIESVRDHRYSATVCDIVDASGETVFTSADMDIDDWETEWRHAKRRLSVDVEEYDCPYDNVACFADDLCVRCKMDTVQARHSDE